MNLIFLYYLFLGGGLYSYSGLIFGREFILVSREGIFGGSYSEVAYTRDFLVFGKQTSAVNVFTVYIFPINVSFIAISVQNLSSAGLLVRYPNPSYSRNNQVEMGIKTSISESDQFREIKKSRNVLVGKNFMTL